MLQVTHITPDFAVTQAAGPDEVSAAAAQGFRTVISFLPDGEIDGQPGATEVRRACKAAGLAFAHVPARKFELFTAETISCTREAIRAAPGPVLAFCSSGQRAAILWASTMVTSTPPDTVLKTLTKAGLDLSYIRDDLEALADRTTWDSEKQLATA